MVRRSEPEDAYHSGKRGCFVLQGLCRGCGFFDKRGIFLRGRVDVGDRAIDFLDAGALLAARCWPC